MVNKPKKIEEAASSRKKERLERDFEPILADLGIPWGSQNCQKNAPKNSSKNGGSKRVGRRRAPAQM